MPMVRVPWNEPFFIQWVLDAGAYGVVVPLVNSREEAAKAGGACRYPPVGYRSAGSNRARLYGGIGLLKQAIRKSSAWSRSKTSTLWHTWTTLADASGIDGFYIGPSDLALQWARASRLSEEC